MDAMTQRAIDDVLRMIAALCGKPIAFLALGQPGSQQCKAVYGSRGSGYMSRITALCDRAVTRDELVEIHDLSLEKQYGLLTMDFPTTDIRFLAMQPLFCKDDHVLGTLCVADVSPSLLTGGQRSHMRSAANTIIQLLEAQTIRTRLADVNALLRHTKIMMLVFDADTLVCADASEVALRALGYHDAIDALTFQRLFPPHDELEYSKLLDDLRSGAVSEQHRLMHCVRRDGAVFPVIGRMKLAHVRNRPALTLLLTDLADAMSANADTSVLDVAFENYPDGVIVVDVQAADQPIVKVNAAFCQVTGYDESEALGKNCRFLQGHEHDQVAVRAMRNAILQGSAYRGVLRNFRKDGSMFMNELTLVPLRNDTGALTHYIGVQRDVTQSLQLETVSRETQERLQLISDNLPGLISYVDAQERVLFFNSRHHEWMPHTSELSGAIHAQDLLGSEAYAFSKPYLKRALAGERSVLEVRTAFPNAIRRFIRVEALPDRDANGAVRGCVVMTTDISERWAMERALFEEKERAIVTLNSIGDGVVTTSSDGTITHLNPVAESITGWSKQEALGQPCDRVLKLVRPTQAGEVYHPIPKALHQNRVVKLEPGSFLVRRDGSELPIDDSVAPIHDREGRVSGSIMVFRDISETHALNKSMAHLAHHDALTELPNRVLLLDRIDQAIAAASRNNRNVAVLFLDLDRFKDVNDSLGHVIGDRLLIQIAQRLTHTVRKSDTVGRLGGDEFVIVLPNVESEGQAAQVAEKILQVMSKPVLIDGLELPASFSIGVALFPEHGRDVTTLMKHADTAMYEAKAAGKCAYRVFSAAMHGRSLRRLEVELKLREALRSNELTLHYQPKFDVAEQRLIGAEALVRWRTDAQTLTSAGEFIAVAEESGLITEIDNFALFDACRQLKAWLDEGLPIVPVAVNVSSSYVESQALVGSVRSALDLARVSAEYLEVELTERVLMKDPVAISGALQSLRDLGVRIAIDDFGVGYSSLSYLRKFPIDVIKIDRSFVQDIVDDDDAKAISSAIISMARSLHLHVVAEGVETTAQSAVLMAHQCTQMQGYLFGAPMDAAAFAELLRSQGLTGEEQIKYA